MRITLISGLLLLGSGFGVIVAQPVITSDNMPQIGTQSLIAVCAEETGAGSYGLSGADQVWDFSGVTELYETQVDFIHPASSYWSDRYPTADICYAYEDSIYEFYLLNADSVSVIGYVAILDGDTTYIDYVDPELQWPFPASLGVSETDFASGTAFNSPAAFDAEIIISAYGTLILPNATYQNVVRIFSNSVFTPSLGSGSTTSRWTWISEDHKNPLLTVLVINPDFGGSIITQVWYDKSPQLITGISDHRQDISSSIYPNPAHGLSTIRVEGNTEKDATVVITDILGRPVFTELLSAKNTITVNSDEIGKGFFLAYLERMDGQRNFIGKLVVE